jgi:hypothetical protein
VEFIPLEWKSDFNNNFFTARLPYDTASHYSIGLGLHVPGWQASRPDHPMLRRLKVTCRTLEQAKAVLEADSIAQQRINAWINYMVSNDPLPRPAEITDQSWSATTRSHAEINEQRINAWLNYLVNNDPPIPHTASAQAHPPAGHRRRRGLLRRRWSSG